MPDIDITSPWPDTRIARLLRPADVVVPLVGAGLSVSSGLPTGAALASWIREQQVADGVDFSGLGDAAGKNPLKTSQILIDAYPERKGELLDAVRAHIRALCEAAELSQELKALARAPSGLILTLNYDDLIERAAEADGIRVESFGRGGIANLITAQSITTPDGILRVVHLHGSVRASSPIVLANDEYQRAMVDGAIPDLFAAVVSSRSLCLLGTSFEEPYLSTLLQRFRPPTPRHVIVCAESNAAIVDNGDGQVNRIVHGVVSCSYSDDDFRAIPGFVAKLTEADGGATRSITTALGDPLYTSRRLLRMDNEKNQDPEVALLLGDLKFTDETELRQRARAIVLGVPGSGKSHLMANLAAEPLPGERTALVRLRAIRDFVGEPAALLNAWLDSSGVDRTSLDTEVVLSGDVRVHLMLDGLDEVSPADRPSAVEAVDRIAEALPQMRITLSSRPTAALEGCGADWERYALRCDNQWQTEFLAKAGTTLEGLLTRLGSAASAVEPLLTIPFFLRRLVELDDAELAAAVSGGDALGVLSALLDQQVRADPNLALVRSGVGQWLGRVAMLMQLTGRRAVALDDLRPLAADLDLGSIETLTNHLANRSLLEEAADQWSFGHRIFSEALVASQLVSEDPTSWLDVVAPEFAGRSAVREDWLAPLDLVCARSQTWRDALRGRDAVTAARLTPPDAELEERSEAATVLWERASGLHIWLDEKFDRGFDDGEIIARLLNDGVGVEAVVARLESALEVGTRYDRANALDALVRVRPQSAFELIRHVLDDEQDSTLRRNAASWARRLGLRDLVEVIIERACSPADEAEARDTASIAIKLTEPLRRAEVGRRILASGNSEIREWQTFDGAPAVENLKWLLDAAKAHSDEMPPYGVERELDEILGELGDPTDEEARVAGELIVVCGTRSPQALDWVANHPVAGVGVVGALNDDNPRLYVPAQLLLAVGSSRLRVHGAPPDIVRDTERMEEARAQSVAMPPLEVRHQIDREEPASPTLVEVLALDGKEPYAPLLKDETRLRREAEQAPPAVKQSLRQFLDREWGSNNLRDAITLTEGGANVEWWAGLVLSYGPPAGLELDDERWVQTATCGWLFTEQFRWVGAQGSQARLDSAAGIADPSPRVLAGLLQVGEGLDSTRVQIRVAEVDDRELSGRRAPGLLEALSRAGAVEALKEVRARGESFAALADPLLARAGDVESQRDGLRRLEERLAQGEYVDRHDESWVESISEPSLLAPIVSAVKEAKKHPRGDDQPFDVSESLLGAIERIGGTPALQVLDELIAERPWNGAQWLQRMRTAVLQRELARAAVGPSELMMARFGLPALELEPEGVT